MYLLPTYLGCLGKRVCVCVNVINLIVEMLSYAVFEMEFCMVGFAPGVQRNSGEAAWLSVVFVVGC